MTRGQRCPSCSSEVPPGKYCTDCGAALAPPAEDATRTSLSQAQSAGGSEPFPSESSSGGRFLPGAAIAGRYRVVGLLGRGGMGEVYRADDLKLNRAVALKFLPSGLEHDPARRARLIDEVRTALQVTHVNVCRVYDIGEYEGQHFISMEYVDGEDLRSLLRRIGRLPPDKALQIARQLCAGLGAAHQQGILHRDLKPANVMLDGRGQAKIMDFGLAGLEASFRGAEVRSGTAAYMAPEQVEGREVTARSDVYSLGLVLHELFTGKTPSGSGPSTPVEGLDPAVERVIRRCLSKSPEDRPSSALAVAAALPGGDPLAAALAAGETPSPELVAAAGAEGALAPRRAWLVLVASLATLALATGLEVWFRQTHGPQLSRTPAALAERARELLRSAGYADLPYAESGFASDRRYYRHIEQTDPSPERWGVLRDTPPAALRFWFRQSPEPIEPLHAGNVLRNYAVDPPFTEPGMTGVQLDLEGRLLQLDAVPPDREPSEPSDSGETARTDWSALLRAAGLDPSALDDVEPTWVPRRFADERAAWTGVYRETPGMPIRVEAAAYEGKPVSFRVVPPWDEPATAFEERAGDRVAQAVFAILPTIALVGGSLLAWRNLRLGRSDRRGALRLAAYLCVVRLLIWVCQPDRYDPDGFAANLAWSLYRFGTVWILYVALEPYLRRIWPRTMVSWARLLEGRLRDPLVGRDVLIGVGLAAAWWLSGNLLWLLIESLGFPLPAGPIELPGQTLRSLASLPAAVAMMLFGHAFFVLNGAFVCLVLLLMLRILLRRTWLAVLAWIPVMALVAESTTGVQLVFSLLIVAWWLGIFFRAGLLPLVLALGLIGSLNYLYLTLDVEAWYFPSTLLFLALGVALAIYGFRIALAGRPAFRADLLEG